MTSKAAKTGPGAMVLVAIEQAFPSDSRILTDDLAMPILPRGQRVNVWLMRRLRNWLVRKTEQRVPGLWAGIMARKRYIDDQAAAHASQALVNLGAGFDTRVYRLPALADVPTWELDEPGNIAAKKARLEKLFQQVPAHVTLVPIDFDHESLADVLRASGYTFEARTHFIWEGVTQYLSEPGVRATFDVLARASPGSRLVFTYVPLDFIEGHKLYGQPFLYQRMVVKDRLWNFGARPDEIEALLSSYGWRLVDHLDYEQLAERYVRDTGRSFEVMRIERIVSAVKE